MALPLGKPTASERVWEVIARQRVFTFEDLVKGAPASYDNARRVVGRLIRAKIVAEEGRSSTGGYKYFSLVGTAEGIPAEVSRRREDWRQQAWNTMRIKRRFTVATFPPTLTVEVKRDTVYRYCRSLQHRGYVRVVGRQNKAGQPMSNLVYELQWQAEAQKPDLCTPR